MCKKIVVHWKPRYPIHVPCFGHIFGSSIYILLGSRHCYSCESSTINRDTSIRIHHCLSLQVESWAWWWNKWLVLLSNGAWKNRLQQFHQQVKGSEMHYLELLWRRTESLRRIISVSWWGLQIAWSWKRGPPFFSASLSEPTSGKYWKIALAMCPLSSTPMPSTQKTFDFEKNVRRICWTRRIPSARFAWKIFNLAPGPHGHTAMIRCWKLASRFIDVVW